MIRLQKSQALQREIRQDDVVELATPTWDLISEAMQAGRTQEALRLLKYARLESERNNFSMVSFAEEALTHVAGIAEAEVEKLIRQRYFANVRDWLAATPGTEETLQRCTESQRSHHASFTVREEPNRYVVTYDPCGSGGRLRRTRDLATTKQAHSWSWSRSGVPYYCCHCCLKWEIIPIELRGYPLRINLRGDRPEDPCVHLFYKRPELIPEEYFTRVGKVKTIK